MKTQDKIRELLIASTLSDHEIAAKIGCSKQWVWLFRNAKVKSPTVDVMDDLHRLLTGRDIMDHQAADGK